MGGWKVMVMPLHVYQQIQKWANGNLVLQLQLYYFVQVYYQLLFIKELQLELVVEEHE